MTLDKQHIAAHLRRTADVLEREGLSPDPWHETLGRPDLIQAIKDAQETDELFDPFKCPTLNHIGINCQGYGRGDWLEWSSWAAASGRQFIVIDALRRWADRMDPL